MMFNALSQNMHSWEIVLLVVWLFALAVAGVIVLAFAGLNKVGITFSEQVRVRLAGAGYWGTLACAAFCLLVQPSLPVPVPVQRQAPVQTAPQVPGLPEPVTPKGGHLVPVGR